MHVPTITGIIERRILANFRVDYRCMAAALPEPFRPLNVNGYAIGGICLIRLKRMRPKLLSLPFGVASENAAHRIAVEWEEQGVTHQGVYIPRRDTDSRLSAWAGGRVFPGRYHHATFSVLEQEDRLAVSMTSDDGRTQVRVAGSVAASLPSSSLFRSVTQASEFFRRGLLGYSGTTTAGRYDGLELRCTNWHMDALDIEQVRSSYFEDESRFPANSVQFDCALLMRNIQHEWHARPNLSC